MIVSLKVKPGSKVDQIALDAAGLLTVKLKAPAQNDRANAYLVELLARELRVAKSAISISTGFANPHKRLEIDISAEHYSQFLARIMK